MDAHGRHGSSHCEDLSRQSSDERKQSRREKNNDRHANAKALPVDEQSVHPQQASAFIGHPVDETGHHVRPGK